MIIFISLYVVVCLLWSVFCLRVQHVIYGELRYSDFLVIVLNFVFAPISLIMGINRITKDFKKGTNTHRMLRNKPIKKDQECLKKA